MSVLNQTAMSSVCRANTLERCVVMGFEVVLLHVTAPPCSASLFWSRLDFESRLVTFISCCMMWKKNMYPDIVLCWALFVIFKLHGGRLPFMLVPCCFGDVITCYHSLVTYIYTFPREVFFVFKMYVFLNSWNAGKMAVLGLFFSFAIQWQWLCDGYGHGVSKWPQWDRPPGLSCFVRNNMLPFCLMTTATCDCEY